MNGTERVAVGMLLAVVALFAPGFLLHAAPRFPGSLVGGLLGIAGASAMVLLLVYSLVKRVTWLKRRAALGGALSFHVYAGAVGAMFGVLHTGHKYQSPLGIALVTALPRYAAGPRMSARTAAVEVVERLANHRGSGTRYLLSCAE